jgi:formylglycine-generating enzyme required for sulfatase activity
MSQQSSRGDGPSGTHRLILRVYRSDGQADAFYLAHGLTIGRSVANTVALPDDDGADRTHARVAFLDDGTATLYSVGPDNEILVDGSAVHQLPLSTGVRFRIGRHQFECLSRQRPAEEGTESATSCPYCTAWDLPQATTRCPHCGQDVLVLNLEGSGLSRLVVPAQFGDFRAQHLVARGGMGVVLKGVHQTESYPVAVKILLPHRNLDAQAGERFRQEASLMAQVQSPEIIRLIHTGQVGRLNYLVMEWMDRGTLRDVLVEHRSQNSLPVFDDVLAWLVDTCRGLAAIHALGIIHRDVKPSNILLADNGHAKLADMGIAKQMADSSHGLTTTGMVPGTTEYMSPEAINPPWLVDQRGDQYSVGVTFYELLTGQRPVGAWPAASSVNRTVPKEFDAFLAKLLSPSPQGRFHDMTAVLHAEDGLLRFLTPRWTYRRRNGIWINYFEAINLSCFPLKDFVADVLVHRKDGSTSSFRMRADLLLAGGRLRKTLVFDQEVTGELAFVEATATCLRGNIELDPAVTRDEEVAKWSAFPHLNEEVPSAVVEHRLLCGKASVLAFLSSLLIPILWLVSFGLVYVLAGGATGKVLASILCAGVLFALFTRRCRLAYLRGMSPILRRVPQADHWLACVGERTANCWMARRRRVAASEGHLLQEYMVLANRDRLNRLSLLLGGIGFVLSSILLCVVLSSPTMAYLLVPLYASQMMLLVGLGLYAEYKARHPVWAFLGMLSLPGLLALAGLPDRWNRRIIDLRSQLGLLTAPPSQAPPGGNVGRLFPPMFWLAAGFSVVPLLAPGGLMLSIVQLTRQSKGSRDRRWWSWATVWSGWQTFVLMLICLSLMLQDGHKGIGSQPPDSCLVSDGVIEIVLPHGWRESRELRDQLRAQLAIADASNTLAAAVVHMAKTDVVTGDLEDIAKRIAINITTALQEPRFGPVKRLKVGTHPAVQYEIHGVENSLRVIYMVTVVDLSSHYSTITAWSPESAQDHLSQDVGQIVRGVRLRGDIVDFPVVEGRLPEEVTNTIGTGVREIANTIGMKLRLIPAGEFDMGGETLLEGSKPVHHVRISRPFYLGETEVTQRQYLAVMGTNPSMFTGDLDRPVENVSWEDAVAFCRKLGEREGKKYRLPTESQWEYACRAGSKGSWTFGDDEGSFGEYAWYDANSGNETHRVGKKRPNAWGLYDMHGNVWEWCSDWYGIYAASPQTDPAGPSTGSLRVLRGGCWYSPAVNCRSANRYWEPGDRHDILGFRVSADLADE